MDTPALWQSNWIIIQHTPFYRSVAVGAMGFFPGGSFVMAFVLTKEQRQACYLKPIISTTSHACLQSSGQRILSPTKINAAENGNDIVADGEKSPPSSSLSSNDKSDTTTDKPKSRLAMLAEDWMAEEEEDELADYWSRFEDNKTSGQQIIDSEKDIDEDLGADAEEKLLLTTEERLDRYFDSRGINKQKEKEHTVEIQKAITKATNILDSGRPPQQAILTLQEVKPYLQVNTRLGGTALVQLANALWQNDQQQESMLLCQELRSNRHVRQQVVKFMQDGPSALIVNTQQQSSFWKGTIFDRDLSSSWWD